MIHVSRCFADPKQRVATNPCCPTAPHLRCSRLHQFNQGDGGGYSLRRVSLYVLQVIVTACVWCCPAPAVRQGWSVPSCLECCSGMVLTVQGGVDPLGYEAAAAPATPLPRPQGCMDAPVDVARGALLLPGVMHNLGARDTALLSTASCLRHAPRWWARLVLWRAGCPGFPLWAKQWAQTDMPAGMSRCLPAQPWLPDLRARVQQQKQSDRAQPTFSAVAPVPSQLCPVVSRVCMYGATSPPLYVKVGTQEVKQRGRGTTLSLCSCAVCCGRRLLLPGSHWRSVSPACRAPLAVAFPGAHPQAAGQWVADGLVDGLVGRC